MRWVHTEVKHSIYSDGPDDHHWVHTLPNGDQYRVYEFVNVWVACFVPHRLLRMDGTNDYYTQRGIGYLTAAGKELVQANKTSWLSSKEEAMRACETHLAILTKRPESNPDKVVAALTAPQREFIELINTEGFDALSDYGTKGERPFRTRVTRMRNALEKLGLLCRGVNRWTDLGNQVAKKIMENSNPPVSNNA